MKQWKERDQRSLGYGGRKWAQFNVAVVWSGDHGGIGWSPWWRRNGWPGEEGFNDPGEAAARRGKT
ncbi:uncharacterized protein DS421_5g168170 [Arachis hypogaea]|nr:uncharacterized protein DS421_5g168170 [Arachis hypogaea]